MTSIHLKQRIQDDIKEAMRAKETLRLSTLRMLLSAIKQIEIDKQISLEQDDASVITIINKLIKQRNDSIEAFLAANRQELADKEQTEMEILKAYLPQQLNDTEIQQAISSAIESVQATSIQDMGKVMNVLKQQLAGRADMTKVSSEVKRILANN